MQEGNKKYSALRLVVGNFSRGLECCTCKTRIIDVACKASGNEWMHTRTLVKNCMVLPDSTPGRVARVESIRVLSANTGPGTE